MFDQINLNQFFGADVCAMRKYGSLTKGKIMNATSDETKINAVVRFDDGEEKTYDIKYLQFVDDSLQQRAFDACVQLTAKPNSPEPPKLMPISIGTLTISVGSNYHPEYMVMQPVFTMKEVEEEFGVHTLQFKGINTAKDSPSVVIVSVLRDYVDHFIYHDYWDENGDFIYTGEGLTGDQEFKRGNWAIYNAENEGRGISLFIKPYKNRYIYQGDFELIDWFWKLEPGADGIMRKAIKFRLRKVHYD